MIKRFAIISFIVGAAYVGLLSFKLWVGVNQPEKQFQDQQEKDEVNKVFSFSFSKYSTNGKKELEIEGDTANILAKIVAMNNVIAKAYAEESPVTITADQGVFDKATNTVHLKQNVVATTQEGARLLTDTLDIHPEQKSLDTRDKAHVTKDNIDVNGLGAHGDSDLKKVQFHKSVTVVLQSESNDSPIPTVITCDGPLEIDYNSNLAIFNNNVVATDHRGKLTADLMHVYYDKTSKKLDKIVAVGNVVITNPEGNATYAEEVTYYAKEGRILMGGDTEAVYYPGSDTKADEQFMFGEKKSE